MEKHRYNLNPHIKHHKAACLARSLYFTSFRKKARPDTFFPHCLVGEADYFLASHHYIGLNPVRADMVNHPADY